MLLFLALTARAVPALAPLPLVVEETHLGNGIRVAGVQVQGSRLVAVQVRVAGGSAEERAGESGLAHLVEHIGFGGSAHAPEGAYDEWLAAVGADNNAWTAHDETVYTVVGPPEALPLMLFLESDRLGWLEGGLTESRLDIQRSVVRAEAEGDAATPHARNLEALNAAVFPEGHPYHRPVMGDVEALGGVTAAQVLDFHQRSHAPRHVSVAIAGAAPPAVLLAEARRWLSEVPRQQGAPLAPAAHRVDPEEPSLRVWRDTVREDRIFVAWPTVPRGHADEPALDLLARLLGSGADAPLRSRRFLERTGLHAVDAWTLNGRHGGLFVVEARGSAGADTVAALESAVSRARLRPRRVEAVRFAWHADAVRSAQGVEALAHLVASCLGRGLPAGCARSEVDTHAAVTASDLARVRARWLLPERRTALLVVDPGRPVPDEAVPVVLP